MKLPLPVCGGKGGQRQNNQKHKSWTLMPSVRPLLYSRTFVLPYEMSARAPLCKLLKGVICSLMFFLSDCVAQENTTGHLHLFWALGLSLSRVRPCKYFCEVDQERKGSFIAYEDRVSIHVLSLHFP